jgi:hypothetical protein
VRVLALPVLNIDLKQTFSRKAGTPGNITQCTIVRELPTKGPTEVPQRLKSCRGWPSRMRKKQ